MLVLFNLCFFFLFFSVWFLLIFYFHFIYFSAFNGICISAVVHHFGPNAFIKCYITKVRLDYLLSSMYWKSQSFFFSLPYKLLFLITVTLLVPVEIAITLECNCGKFRGLAIYMAVRHRIMLFYSIYSYLARHSPFHR